MENLPVYGAIVLSAHAAGIVPSAMGTLAVVFIVARVAQSSVHMLFEETKVTVFLRFCFFFVQVAAMIWMIVVVLRIAARTA